MSFSSDSNLPKRKSSSLFGKDRVTDSGDELDGIEMRQNDVDVEVTPSKRRKRVSISRQLAEAAKKGIVEGGGSSIPICLE